MQIYVNSQLAALKKGTSFEYVSENRLFSGSDGYSLTISFPLRGCATNLAIFGHINRADVAAQKVIFDCEIRAKGFRKYGSITITEISETEVKCQFLEGRSEQNFSTTFDDIFINELDLGQWPTGSVTPSTAWNGAARGYTCVALPWVNNSTGIIQNCPEWDKDSGKWAWHKDTSSLSWQIYLVELIRRICNAVGYSFDIASLLTHSELKHLLVCNALPAAWCIRDFARALPHWSVSEFFSKLELFLCGEFDIDHRGKFISFAFSADVVDSLPIVVIDNVVEDFSTEVTVEDDKCEYIGIKNLVYADSDMPSWKFLSCDWLIREYKRQAVRYDTLAELVADNKWLSSWMGGSSAGRNTNDNKLLYAADVDCYFCIRSVKKTLVTKHDGWRPNQYRYDNILQPLNQFGGRIIDPSEDADSEEIEFVPVPMDYTDETYGTMMFLSPSSYSEQDDSSEVSGVSIFGQDPVQRKQEIDDTFYNTQMVWLLERGKQDKSAEYYNRIFLAFWPIGYDYTSASMPQPLLDTSFRITPDWNVSTHFTAFKGSLRINRSIDSLQNSGVDSSEVDSVNGSVCSINQVSTPIDPKQKSTFKFLSDTIPDVRSIFQIRGKRYLAEKITATFTESGMSQLLKISVYPILD